VGRPFTELNWCRRWLPAFALLVLLPGGVVRAQTPAEPGVEPLPRGVVIERVECGANPQQSYALYLPSAYTPERRWPILYIFDPAARGGVPVKLAHEAAERYGYVVAGSNNSQNGPPEPQQEAAKAMWADTHARFSLDDRRVYVAGFSGGLRLATALALGCQGCVAGVIAHGAGLPAGAGPLSAVPFSYFATVGDLDFNFPELVRLSARFDARGTPNRLRRFEGSHEWGPAPVWEEALAWLELRAMKEGRRPRDAGFLAAYQTQAVERAQAREESGDLYAAAYEYRKLAEDLRGLSDVSDFDRKAAELADSEPARRAREQERKEIEQQEAWVEEMTAQLVALEQTAPGSLASLSPLSRLREKGEELRGLVQKAQTPQEAVVPRRTLSQLLALAYETGQEGLRTGSPARAAVYFQVMTYLAPDAPFPFYHLARAYARAGNQQHALWALQQAVEKGFTNVAALKATAEFASLQQAKEFQEILQRLAPP